jgi:glycerophosphoryl diester phosphodiesterase
VRGGSAIFWVLAACGGEPIAELVPLDASQFDCRAVAPPQRTNSVPLDCILDPTCDQKLITGHRGAGGPAALYAPENSIEAMRLAILLGIDVIEVDVRDTLDGDLVLMHDGDLMRTTGDPRAVSEVSRAELNTIPLDHDGFPGDFSCTTIPTFAAVLELAKGRVNIDVDTKTSRADLVAIAIRDAGMIDQAFVSAGEDDKLVLARETVPEIRLQARPDTVEEYEELAARLDRPPEILEIPPDEIEAFRPIADAIGSKLFINVFLEDVAAYAEGDLTAYGALFSRGADVEQSEFPSFVIQALGRERWSALPEHRMLSLGASPLLD